MVRSSPQKATKRTPVVLRHKEGQEGGLVVEGMCHMVQQHPSRQANRIYVLYTTRVYLTNRLVPCFWPVLEERFCVLGVLFSLAFVWTPMHSDEVPLLTVVLVRGADWLALANACVPVCTLPN